MSSKAMAAVWNFAPYAGSALLVLLAFADWCDENFRCSPKPGALVQRTRLQKRQLLRVLHDLREGERAPLSSECVDGRVVYQLHPEHFNDSTGAVHPQEDRVQGELYEVSSMTPKRCRPRHQKVSSMTPGGVVRDTKSSTRKSYGVKAFKTSLSQVPCDEEKVPSEKPQRELVPEAPRLATLLKNEILRNKPDFKITPQQENKWAEIADLMIRRDGRNPQQIANLIHWAQHDSFWMANILSMKKLREQFDRLELRKRNGNARPAGPKRPSGLDYVPDQIPSEMLSKKVN